MRAPSSAALPASPEPFRPAAPEGVTLCLSGGGYRAMLFHAGALWRLNEWGLLGKVDRVTSVSGGAIAAAALGLGWERLAFDGRGVATNLEPVVLAPLRRLAERTVDVRAVLRGALEPRSTVGERVAAVFRDDLCGAATLDDLPARPDVVFSAMDMRTRDLWHFSRQETWNRHTSTPEVRVADLAEVVAASAAYPPWFSPVRAHGGPDGEPLILADGGVLDPLALEGAWNHSRTLLVSDAMAALGTYDDPTWNWIAELNHVRHILERELHYTRLRTLLDAFEAGARTGAWWTIRDDSRRFELPDALPSDPETTQRLAAIPTRLGRIGATEQEELVNWGYAITDATCRTHFDPSLPPPAGWPYPRHGLERS